MEEFLLGASTHESNNIDFSLLFRLLLRLLYDWTKNKTTFLQCHVTVLIDLERDTEPKPTTLGRIEK